eukprot:921092-Amphidinium_carterae.1
MERGGLSCIAQKPLKYFLKLAKGPGGLAALSSIKEPYSVDRLGRDQVNRAFRAKPPKQLS